MRWAGGFGGSGAFSAVAGGANCTGSGGVGGGSGGGIDASVGGGGGGGGGAIFFVDWASNWVHKMPVAASRIIFFINNILRRDAAGSVFHKKSP